jgi:Mg2+ and Co2+ transporter CorA
VQFHFEDISKHAERVQGKIQQFGLSRTMSSRASFPSPHRALLTNHSDWIAYGLMDSIVDTFFPLIDFIEGETSEVEAFVSDPLGSSMSERDAIALNTRSNDEIVGIIVEQPPTPDDKRDVSDDSLGATLKIKRSSTRSVLAALPQLLMPTSVLALLPKTWTTSKKTTTESTEMVDMSRFKSFRALRERKRIKTLEYDLNHRRFNKMLMLQRIAGTRKLVTGLSRLLGAKSDVVRGLQKRSMTENRGRVKRAEIGQDITLYFDDLFGEFLPLSSSVEWN